MQYNIIGGTFPVVTCTLADGESMITEGGSMVWMTPNMGMSTTGGGTRRGELPGGWHNRADNPLKGDPLMMSFGIDQVNFRDLYRQVLFVGYSLREPLAAAGVADLPEDADGMLAYGYIDPDAGLSFEALAPARMSDLTVYPEFDLMRKLKCAMKVAAEGEE